MEGITDSEEHQGVIPRAVKALFERLSVPGRYKEFSVKVTYLEIYNEELGDLLLDPVRHKSCVVAFAARPFCPEAQ